MSPNSEDGWFPEWTFTLDFVLVNLSPGKTGDRWRKIGFYLYVQCCRHWLVERKNIKYCWRKCNSRRESSLCLINRNWVAFLYDNTRPHTAMVTKDRGIWPGENCSFLLFSRLCCFRIIFIRSLQNYLNGVILKTTENVHTGLSEFFSSKMKEVSP